MPSKSNRLRSLACIAAVAAAGTHAAEPDAPWPLYNRSLDGQRHSPLARINRDNVDALAPVCEIEVGEHGKFQAGPIVAGGRLFVTTTHTTLAVNPGDCSVAWRHVHRATRPEIWRVNRGGAWLDGRIFRGTVDGWLLALDAATGAEIWRTDVGDPADGFLTAAPIAWNGRVFIGTSGGDWGARGRMMAFDAASGARLWSFNTVPAPGEPGAETWDDAASLAHGGGATWTSYSLDPASGELFVPVGNPAPAYSPAARPGSNLYTNSVLVLDAATGRHQWHLQLRPADGLDLDLGAAPLLHTTPAGRPMVVAGSKDGHVYGIDRERRAIAYRTAVTTVRNADALPTPEGVRACPGNLGGVQWNGPAYDPALGRIYVGAVDWCMLFRSAPAQWSPGRFFMGGSAVQTLPDEPRAGWINALDATSGRVIWRHRTDSPVFAAVTPTAGGILFAGTASGHLLALDARDGRVLRDHDAGGALAGGIVTYLHDERQYVAFTSGNISRGAAFGREFIPKLVIMAVDPGAGAPRRVAVPDIEPPLLAPDGPTEAAYRGQALYRRWCQGCHGGAEGGLAPVLRHLPSRLPRAGLQAVLAHPPSTAMPALHPHPLSANDIDDLFEFFTAWH
ncbi:MAG: PQQ-binding-like beta-propeller repeat protein [Gammaproteobacteria bacterium]